MSVPLSYSVGQLHEPLTPIELELKRSIAQCRQTLAAMVHQALASYGASQQDIQEYISCNLTRIFNSYIEQAYPLTSADINAFISYAIQYTERDIRRQNSYQVAYNGVRQQRTRDPRGQVSLPHPQVL